MKDSLQSLLKLFQSKDTAGIKSTALHLHSGFMELKMVNLSQWNLKAILVVWFSEQVPGLDPQPNPEMWAQTVSTSRLPSNFKAPSPGVPPSGFGALLPNKRLDEWDAPHRCFKGSNLEHKNMAEGEHGLKAITWGWESPQGAFSVTLWAQIHKGGPLITASPTHSAGQQSQFL